MTFTTAVSGCDRPTPSRRTNTPTVFRMGLGFVLILALFLAVPTWGQTPPSFSKSFSPSAIGPGSVSTLQLSITNPNASPVSELAFSDTLPAGMTLAANPNVVSSCAGTVTAVGGGGVVSLADGSAGGGDTCAVSVDVTSATPGTHTNTTGDLTSDAGNSGTATADLVVDSARPGFSKSFSPSSVNFGQRSRLTLTIDNSGNASPAFNASFTDNLPDDMVVASPANRQTTCTNATVTAAVGGFVVSLVPNPGTNQTVAAGASCTVGVDVIGNAVGVQVNRTGDLTSVVGFNLVSSGIASGSLTVTVERIAVSKSFTDDPVAPGGTVTLEFTVRNLDRRGAATNITFTDDLDAVVSGLAATGLPLADPCGPGSQLTGTSVITLAGGNLAPEATCTFSAILQVPTVPSGAYTNTTSSISADINGQSVNGDPAVDDLFIQPRPQLVKEFIDDPVGAGDDVTLRFTATNTSTTLAATDVAFIDELTTFLPFPVSTVLPANPCGAGSSIALVSLGTERQALSLSNGTLAASASCSFDVTLTIPIGVASNTYVNIADPITATVDGETLVGNSATDNLLVVAAPSLIKEFTDDPAAPGDTVTLEFTLTHDENAPGDATDITFTDDLDAALSGLVATGLPAADVCGTGSSLSGTMTLTLSGGTLSPGSSCTFSATLNVPSDAPPGSHTNTTSGVVATVSGVSAAANPATDDLRIAGLQLTKEFIDDPALPGGTTTLRFTVDNVSQTEDATAILFVDDLDQVIDGLVATGLPQNDLCGTGSVLEAISGGTFIRFLNGSLLATESCSFDVVLSVPGAVQDGTYTNRTASFSATVGGASVSFENASDDLVIASEFLALSKEFIDDPVAPGGVATLRFTLSNLSDTETATEITFSDDLEGALAGLVGTSGTQNDVCGAGSQLAGSSLLLFTNGTLAPSGSCAFDVSLSVPASVSLGTRATNVTSAVIGVLNESMVNGPPAQDDLLIEFLTLSKAFGGPVQAGDTVTLSFNITNLSGDGIIELSFIDDLDAMIPGLVAVGLPATDVCGAGSSFSGTGLLTLSGASLLPAGSCSFDVTLSVPASTSSGDYLNVTSELLQFGTQAAEAATATLTVTGDDDDDNDDVPNSSDICPGTEIPEDVPTRFLGFPRYALVDSDTTFDSFPAGLPTFTTTDTVGCSCDQIIDSVPLPRILERIQRRYGCHILLMKLWTLILNPDSTDEEVRKVHGALLRRGGVSHQPTDHKLSF